MQSCYVICNACGTHTIWHRLVLQPLVLHFLKRCVVNEPTHNETPLPFSLLSHSLLFPHHLSLVYSFISFFSEASCNKVETLIPRDGNARTLPLTNAKQVRVASNYALNLAPFSLCWLLIFIKTLTRMSALNCILLNSLVAIKLASSLTVFSLRVLKCKSGGKRNVLPGSR